MSGEAHEVGREKDCFFDIVRDEQGALAARPPKREQQLLHLLASERIHSVPPPVAGRMRHWSARPAKKAGRRVGKQRRVPPRDR